MIRSFHDDFLKYDFISDQYITYIVYKKKLYLQPSPTILSNFVRKHFHPPTKIVNLAVHHPVKFLQIHANQLAYMNLKGMLCLIFSTQSKFQNVHEWIQFPQGFLLVKDLFSLSFLRNERHGVNIRIWVKTSFQG